jgi:hypothetical protein
MTNLNVATKQFVKHDDYMTPKIAWENIQQFIPKDKILWEAFYGDGKSGRDLRDLGFTVFHEPIDFFKNEPPEWDMIVSNPPFSQAKEILKRLMVLDKPFILILPTSKICTSYFREWKDKIQIIVPKKRIHFQKFVNGEEVANFKNACYFDCFYYCYKMNFPNDINWIE